jgi:adenylate kinase
MKVLKIKNPDREILYIYTGQEFRKFIQGQSYTQKISKILYESGGLMPEFLTVNMWVAPLIENFRGDQNVIFDGSPRKIHEAGVLNSIFDFYNFEKPWVVNIDISNEEAVKRLMARKRIDDSEEDIKKRLGWYDTDVSPTIEYYRNNPNYKYIQIDGGKAPEIVHADIVEKLGLV